MLQSLTRSKDLRTQKLQGCILKPVRVISKVIETLTNPKNSKNLSLNNLRNSIGPVVHDYMDSLALLSHVNSSLEQTRRDNIAYCLDNQYHTLRKNVPSESEFPFGGDLPKRALKVTTNKRLFSMPSKPYKTLQQQSQQQQQAPKTSYGKLTCI